MVCADCDRARGVVQALNILRRESGACVTVNCQNEEGNGPNNEAVEVCASWTNWQPSRFEGQTLHDALTKAVTAMAEGG